MEAWVKVIGRENKTSMGGDGGGGNAGLAKIIAMENKANISVSYTHLDVYKRQPPTLPPTLSPGGSVRFQRTTQQQRVYDVHSRTSTSPPPSTTTTIGSPTYTLPADRVYKSIDFLL